MAITVDSGADISIVPIECTSEDQMMGYKDTAYGVQGSPLEGEVCNITLKIKGREFRRKAIAVAGELISWTPCLDVQFRNHEDIDFLKDMADEREAGGPSLYHPLSSQNGRLTTGVLVSQGEGETHAPAKHTDNKQVQQVKVVELEEDSMEDAVGGLMNIDVGNIEASGDHGQVEEVESVDGASVSVEGVGESLGGRAVEESEMILDGIKGNRSVLIDATKRDETLKVARGLGELNKEGYRYKEGVLMRSRIDRQGQVRDQICLPSELRRECLTLAHTRFGHQGRNKMQALIAPYFYWPTLSRDCQQFIRECVVCQKADKSRPPRSPLQLREVVTVPSERVAVDIVGPFPTAKGGFQYLLTAIDMATRWPEAIPLRSITTKSIIHHLTSIFTHSGFPKAIVSDNGQQFVGREFSRWLKVHGISHSRASPYHPQGNGVVERMHRTLNAIVSKTTGAKGNWASVVPMALYFLRCTPSDATGLSPFMAKQGWEPSTPLSVLYEAWSDKELGDIDLTEFVLTNSERVEALREASSLHLRESMSKRKAKWDKRAKVRRFEIGDEVLTRKPGLCGKLEDSWEGPYHIYAVNSPVSYGVDRGDRKIPSVHISLMKRFEGETEREHKTVKRTTTVMDEDKEGDEITERYSEVKVSGGEGLSRKQKCQVAKILDRYDDILTKEPGLVENVEFGIDTGNHAPVYQRAYNTPAHFRSSIDLEIDWLLQKGFIQPSSSPWASPIVPFICLGWRRCWRALDKLVLLAN